MAKIKMVFKGETVPRYETTGASGMDICAYLPEIQDVEIEPGKRFLVPTGIFVQIPTGYELQIRARSGLAIKYGICLANGIGTIDEDYRGELQIPLINLGEDTFKISHGDRIAQMVMCKYEKVTIEMVENLDDSERGAGGFGHTGISRKEK